MERASLFLWTHPVLWPAVLFTLFAPVHLLRTVDGKQSSHFTSREARVLVAGGVAGLGLLLFSICTYLFSSRFLDLWESLIGSVTSIFVHGGAVYPALTSEERYGTPYGPFLYLLLGLSQAVFGPSAFATKLPCSIATLLAVAIFWLVVRRQSRSSGIALVFAGLEGALLLAFRAQAFWPKPDGAILFAVTLGLVAALRCGSGWQILFGFCLGMALDLKPHAVAYFLPLLVLAHHRGWTRWGFALAGVVAFSTAALPYLAYAQFSFVNYLQLLQMTMREGFSIGDALHFLKWIGLLAALALVADHWQRRSAAAVEPREDGLRFFYRAAIALGLLLVAVPGSAVGAGARHAMPFVPLVLYDLSQRFSAGSIRLCGPDRPVWRLVAYCALASCLMVATQTAASLIRANANAAHPGLTAQAELQRVLRLHSEATMLMGAGSDEHLSLELLRHEVVFAGQPIGIDLASAMDSRRAGLAEPNLTRLVSELRARRGRPVVWIVPRGEPFSVHSIYDGQPIFSPGFRHDFENEFILEERTASFDVYAEKAQLEGYVAQDQ